MGKHFGYLNELNEGKGQNKVITAEDDGVSHGDCKKMRAGRQGKFYLYYS